MPGGDTQVVSNFEYRVPIAGPVTLACFVDLGTNFIAYPSQLKINHSPLFNITRQFPYFPTPSEIKPIAGTNFRPYSSTGLELQVILPIVNAPFRVFYGYNWLTVNTILRPPQQLPPISSFPNQATYNSALVFFQPYRFRERQSRVGFTVARTF
jgi:outer membrane protein insertion porin family